MGAVSSTCLQGSPALDVLSHAASEEVDSSTRCRNNSKLPRPYILRLMYFSLLTNPSVMPLLYASEHAASKAGNSF